MGVIGNLMFAVGFKANTKPLQDAENSIGSLKLGVIGLGAAIGGMAIASIAASSEFEKSMSQVQMATDQTAEQMEATREVAKNLYSQNFGEDWADLGSSIAAVQQVTGQTGAELEKTTRNALLLRDAFGYEVNESIDAVTNAVQNFGITSDQAYNLMAQGTAKGLNASGDLMDTVQEYSTYFDSLGFSANEMFDTLAAGAGSGARNIDLVADTVKEFGIISKDNSESTREGFQMLGLDADKMMGTLATGGPAAKKTFDQIVSMISDIEDPVQRNTVGIAFFGTKFEDLESTIVGSMGNAASQFDMTKDSMDEINKIRFDKPGEALAMFFRQLETGILIPIGEKMLPYLNAFGQWLSDHQPQIEAFGAAVGDKIGGAIDGIALAVQASLPTLQAIWDTVSGAASSFAQWEWSLPIVVGLTAALVTYKGVLVAVSAAQKIQAMWTARATIKQAALNLVMSLNPIGLIIAAIVGLVAAFVIAYKRSDKFRAIIDKAWAGIKAAAEVALNFFTVTVPEVFNTVVNFIKTWGGKFIGFLVNPVQTGVNLVKQNWDKIKGFAVTVFNGIIAFIIEWGPVLLAALMGPTGIAVALVVKYWDEIKATTITIFENVRTFISNAWDSIKSKVVTTGLSIWMEIKNTWNKVTGFLGGINLFEIGKGIIQGLINGVTSMMDTVVTKVSEIGTSIKNGLSNALDAATPDWMKSGVSIETSGGIDGSHAKGLSYVPFDGYIAELHKGERVLTAEENESYNSASLSPAVPSKNLAPARAQGTGATAGKMDIAVKIDLRADASSANVSQDVAATVRAEVQKVLDEFSRRFGVQLEVSS